MNASSSYLRVKFEDLTAFHRGQIIERAKNWRLTHKLEILQLIMVGRIVKGIPPLGSNIFDPSKWNGANWIWFVAKNKDGLTH